jgi:uncharacterized protein (DUF427 family)
MQETTGGRRMAHISITPADGVWTVRTDDSVLAESRGAMALAEGSMAPVIYFPRADVAMALLERSETVTTCPHKGAATYYSYAGPGGTVPDVAWSYEDAVKEDVAAIRGALAFYPSKLAVEKI